MEKWQEDSLGLWREGKSWNGITEIIKSEHFHELSFSSVREKVRGFIRGLPEYKEKNKDEHSSVEYNSDGSIVSTKFIKLHNGQKLTPNEILSIHGLDPSKWQVSHCINNFWNSQLKGGALQISYQSKLIAKPIDNGIDFAEIEKHFLTLDRKAFTPPIVTYRNGSLMAEVNLADLHVGKLCWRGDTPENFDYKIARDMFFQIVGEIVNELKDKPLEFITFVWANDFFNSDTVEKTTTGGTPQDTDIREKKLFNVGVEMLVRGIEMLSQIAPVKTFYTPSNHDELSGYHALKYIEAWFRKDPNVTIETDAYPRKYQLYGNTLLGYCHGQKENSNGTKEKASRLASLMPIEARAIWSKAKFFEMHTAHLHSEQMIQEINGVIVRRISSPTAADSWHTGSGFLGSVRKAQTFLYDKERGLVQVINTPVRVSETA